MPRSLIAFALMSCLSLFGQTDIGLPLSKDRLVQALQYRAFTTDQILARVQERGVDFQAGYEDIQLLRSNGASAKLISAVRERYRPLSEVKTRKAEGPDDILVGPPLMEREVVLLLKAKVSADKIAQAVAARGVDFPLTPAYNKDIWGVGGNLTLMGEILLCSRAREPHAQASDLFPVPDGPNSPPPSAGQVQVAVSKPSPTPPPVPPAPVAAPAPVRVPEQSTKTLLPKSLPKPEIVEPEVSGKPRRVTVEPGLQATKLINRVMPVYPAMSSRRPSGMVRLEVTIDVTGKVIATKSLGGDPELVTAATNAVRKWTYRQTVITGEPVEVVTQVEMDFKPRN